MKVGSAWAACVVLAWFPPLLWGETASGFRVEGPAALNAAAVIRAVARFDLSLEPPIDGPRADDVAFYLQETLHDRGYPHARVDFRFAGDEVVFHVEEGEQFRIHKISFEGGAGIDEGRQRAIFESALRQQTLTPVGRIGYVESALDVAASALTDAYRNGGFVHAAVGWESDLQRRGADVLVRVDQGARFTVASVQLQGEGIPENLGRELQDLQGQTYYPGFEAIATARLIEGLQSAGHFNATARGSIRLSDGGNADLLLDAAPGPKFEMGDVVVEGGGKTRVRSLIGRLGLSKGEPYDATMVAAGMRRLWRTGAFAEIKPEWKKGPDNTIDLHLKVEEAPAKQITTTLGYGQWERFFATIDYADSNFLGSLNRFFVSGAISTKTYGILAGITDPWVFRSEAEGTLSAYFLRTETPAYRSTFYGGSVGVERRFDPPNTTSWRAAYEWRVTADTTVFAETDIDGALTDYRLGAVTFGQTLDRRNNPLSPMSGFLLSWDGAVASRALLGEISFGRMRTQATAYIPLRRIDPERPFVPFFVFNHRAGIIAPYADTSDVPVQERFFLGGPDSVRSFQLDGMAPRDRDGDPAGGEFFLLANAELQVPIWRVIYGLGFLDVGNLASKVDTFEWDDTRFAAGLGLRVYTPLGAVRVDYGHNLVRGPGDPLGAWQFGFGFTF